MKKIINNHKLFGGFFLMILICIGIFLITNLFNSGIQKDFKTLQQSLINPKSIEVLDAYRNNGSSLFFISCSDNNGNEINVYALVVKNNVYFDNEMLVSAGLQEKDAYKTITKRINSKEGEDLIYNATQQVARMEPEWQQIDISMFKTK